MMKGRSYSIKADCLSGCVQRECAVEGMELSHTPGMDHAEMNTSAVDLFGRFPPAMHLHPATLCTFTVF